MREIVHGGRFVHMTIGEEKIVGLIMQKCRQQDDGQYTLLIENEHGSDQANVRVYVTEPGGMDFRAMLKHREYERWLLEKDGLDDVDLKKREEERRPSLKPSKVCIYSIFCAQEIATSFFEQMAFVQFAVDSCRKQKAFIFCIRLHSYCLSSRLGNVCEVVWLWTFQLLY